jgi:hypothetical protein
MLIYFVDVWNILREFGKSYDHFGTFGVDFGTFFPALVSRTEKNLATLDGAGDLLFSPRTFLRLVKASIER